MDSEAPSVQEPQPVEEMESSSDPVTQDPAPAPAPPPVGAGPSEEQEPPTSTPSRSDGSEDIKGNVLINLLSLSLVYFYLIHLQ